MKRILYITLLFCAYLANASAVEYDDVKLVPNPKTANANAFVSNPDGILSNATVEMLNSQLHLLEQETSAELAVVAVNSIGSQEIEDFANTLFNYWGIGKSDKDNGVLVLFVLDQRAIRFEIGYGLESVLPDAICKRIQMQVMIPEFKNGNYDAGILEGVKAAESYIREEDYEFSNTGKPLPNLVIVMYGILLFVALIAVFIVQRNVKKVKNSRYLLKNNQERYEKFISSDYYKGGIGCFLAFAAFVIVFCLPFIGLFLLIGAPFKYCIPFVFSPVSLIPAFFYEKYWKKKFRNQPVACPKCGKKMKLLSEEEDNKYLNDQENLEDKLKSVDADVFRCEDCDENVIFKYDNPKSKYKKCPSCRTKAMFMKSSKTTVRATYVSSGMKKETHLCKFCNHTTTKKVTLPRLTRSSSGGSGGSSSSGGSFGGGSSGGGGSTSRW